MASDRAAIVDLHVLLGQLVLPSPYYGQALKPANDWALDPGAAMRLEQLT